VKKIVIVLIFAFQIAYPCPGSFFDMMKKLLCNQSNQTKSQKIEFDEIKHIKQKLARDITYEFKKLIQSYKDNKITEQKLKKEILGMHFSCMSIFPPENLNQLFPGVTFVPIESPCPSLEPDFQLREHSNSLALK